MKEIVEIGHEDEHLSWFMEMGLWETCFFIEVYYIDEGRIDNNCLCYDEYFISFYYDYCEGIECWDFMDEWRETSNKIRLLNRRDRYRKRYAAFQ